MSKLVFNIPNKQTPGFFRRQKQALQFLQRYRQTSNEDPNLVDEICDWLANYITEPADHKEAAELLFNEGTQEQYEMLLAAIAGIEGESPLPTTSATS